VQILAIRLLRDMIFLPGSSVGFYPTWLFCFLIIAPYCLLLGFLLPFSLFVLRSDRTDYPGTRIYIADNIGDISGGLIFSFLLVYLVDPLTAIFLAHLPLLAATYPLFDRSRARRAAVLPAMISAAVLLAAGMCLEIPSLAPREGELVYHRDTRYGRVAIHRDGNQLTLFEDGVPVFSSQNLSIAEETIHYPLCQLDNPRQVLLISAEGGVMAELKKYRLRAIDYVELDPELAAVQFQFGLLRHIKGLNVVYQDGRAYLARVEKTYDAIIANLPEPDTFQINRFYTGGFFNSAKKRLARDGVLSFSMEGFDNYLAESQRQQLSSLYNTAKNYFKHVMLLPGQKVFFLCSDRMLTSDIPAVLADKGIATDYISGFYDGNLTRERIERLNAAMDPLTPRNSDNRPYLMRLMFSRWFGKFQMSPLAFFVVIVSLCVIYLLRISREEFVLFSTGCMTMGSEILVIFAFQIYFGYIYLQIGIIITVFLAGLLPGAWLGHRFYRQGKTVLTLADLVLIACPVLFILAVCNFADRLPVSGYLVFGFVVSLACGFQFPVILHLMGSDNRAATRTFSADLIGAAWGTLLTSVLLIPYVGIIWATVGLIGIKLISLTLISTAKKY
jgi:spermidine synthase